MTTRSRKAEHRYGIGAVAKLTGLSDHTIRVWERRYGAVVAERAANGRRVYGPDDVEKLGLLKTLTDRGISISQIAGDSLDALRERTQALGELATTPVPELISVAMLGEFLPGLFTAHERDIAPVKLTVADNNRDTFVADLARHPVDVVVVESPVLDANVARELLEFMQQASAARGVLVYSFGRAHDVELASDSHVVALRSPVNVEELCAAILRTYTPTARSGAKAAPAEDESDPEWRFSGPIAPRRFTNRQLATLTRASTAIDCECPHHLAQLVGDLTAFEIYSAQCANRDDDDAALHRYLHQTTAQARALIEIALERVAAAEGIDY